MNDDKEMFFPKYINDYRLFVYFPLDMLAVFFAALFFVFWIMSLFFHILFAILAGIASAIYAYKMYKRYKKEVPRGFLFHFLYVLGFASLNPHPQDDEMLEMDVESFIPEGYETYFID